METIEIEFYKTLAADTNLGKAKMKSQDESSCLSRKSVVDRLEFLVKYKENSELKSMIEKSTLADLTFDSGMSLLHLAVKYNNTNIIPFLMEFGCDVNAVNSFGITPLVLAILSNQYETVKFLLNADAKIFTTNVADEVAFKTLVSNKTIMPKTVFGEYLRKLNTVGLKAQPIKQISTAVDKEICVTDIVKNLTFQEFIIKKQLALVLLINYFAENMEFDYNFDGDKVPEILVKHLTIELFVLLNSKQVMRAMLDRRTTIDYKESEMLLEIAINLADAETMTMILQHGPKKSARKQMFVDILFFMLKNIKGESPKALDFLLQNLAKFDVIEEKHLDDLNYFFKKGNSNVVRLLLKHEINVYIKNKFSSEMLVNIFMNEEIDVADLLQNRKFDVDAQNHAGFSGLHLAMSSGSERNVKFLLDSGADPNVKAKYGRKETPLLYHPGYSRCVKLLLEHGADIQMIDSEGSTIIDKSFDRMLPRVHLALEFILARLAFNESQNVPIESHIKLQIDRHPELATYYFECQTDLMWLKAQTIFKSVTFYSLLTCQPENIAHFVCSNKTVFKILKFFRDQLKYYYYDILREKLRKALEIYSLRRAAANFLAKKTILSMYFDCWTLEYIIRFLSNEDLLVYSEKI